MLTTTQYLHIKKTIVNTKFILFFCFISLSTFGQKPWRVPTDTTCSLDSISLKHCSCDKLEIISKKIVLTEKEKGVFDGNGTCWASSLYNKDKIITKCGLFKNYKLTDGLKFIYDASGKLVEIEQYYKGNKIDSCKME